MMQVNTHHFFSSNGGRSLLHTISSRSKCVNPSPQKIVIAILGYRIWLVLLSKI